MQPASQEILQWFPSERHRRFWNSSRSPLFTLLSSLVISCLAWIGIMPIWLALWCGAFLVMDEITLTPISAMFTAANNFLYGRKKIKAIVVITIVSLALIGGGLLGYVVLAKMPMVVAMLQRYIDIVGCSPFFYATGAILGAYIAGTTHVFSARAGFFLGTFIGSLLPFYPPLIVDILFINMAACAYLAALITKSALKYYFKQVYGEPNADGYERASSLEEQEALFTSQSKKFKVSVEEFKNLVLHCKEKILAIKKEPHYHFPSDLLGARAYTSNAFKDVYHSLMQPDGEVEATQTLLACSTNLPNDLQTPDVGRFKVAVSYCFGAFFKQNLDDRIRDHQIKIHEGGGLDQEFVRPFLLTR